MRPMDRDSKETGTRKACATLAATLLLAAAEALAQEKQTARAMPVATPQQERPERRIVVSLADRKLALIENGRVVKVYPVAVGAAGTPSPAGEFKVIQRLTNPTYYSPGVVIPPGKENPLGPRWLGLSLRGSGIHGTNVPRSIGRRASHGCIRMRNRDVEELFERVRLGDIVELHRKRPAELAEVFGGGRVETATASATAVAETDGDLK